MGHCLNSQWCEGRIHPGELLCDPCIARGVQAALEADDGLMAMLDASMAQMQMARYTTLSATLDRPSWFKRMWDKVRA